MLEAPQNLFHCWLLMKWKKDCSFFLKWSTRQSTELMLFRNKPYKDTPANLPPPPNYFVVVAKCCWMLQNVGLLPPCVRSLPQCLQSATCLPHRSRLLPEDQGARYPAAPTCGGPVEGRKVGGRHWARAADAQVHCAQHHCKVPPQQYSGKPASQWPAKKALKSQREREKRGDVPKPKLRTNNNLCDWIKERTKSTHQAGGMGLKGGTDVTI